MSFAPKFLLGMLLLPYPVYRCITCLGSPKASDADGAPNLENPKPTDAEEAKASSDTRKRIGARAYVGVYSRLLSGCTYMHVYTHMQSSSCILYIYIYVCMYVYVRDVSFRF